MKTARLLQTLEQQLTRLQTQITPLAAHATLSARFDRQLFQTRSTKMQGYLDEAYAHFEEMKQQRQQQYQQATTLEDQQRLAREITAFDGRLTRCREALEDIERILARITR